MKIQHTPGPWRIGDAGATVFGPKTDSPSPKTIATVSVAIVIGEENKANARLIAAAPELLDALKDYLCDLNDNKGTWTKERLKQLIAKAEGK